MADTKNAVWILSLRWTIQTLDLEWEEGVDRLKTWCGDNCKAWVFQLEDTGGNRHFQGYVNMNDKIRAKQLGAEMNDDFHGIEMRPASNAGKRALQKYCMKTESRVHGPWADRVIYMGQDLPTKLLGWQQELKAYLLGPVDERELIWVYDPEGNSGKSAFCKYMSFHHGTLKLTYGNSGDLLNLVSKSPGRKAYLFDLTRTKPALFSSADLYSAMEDVKNGHFVNTKYETEEVLMAQPHVVIFANQRPDAGSVSEDRWNVVHIRSYDKPPLKRRKRFAFSTPDGMDDELADESRCYHGS